MKILAAGLLLAAALPAASPAAAQRQPSLSDFGKPAATAGTGAQQQAMRSLAGTKVSAAQAASLPRRTVNGRQLVQSGGQWYGLVAAGAGNYTLVAAGAGN